MSSPLILKDPGSESLAFRDRAIVVATVMGLLLLTLTLRIAQIQIVDYDHYTTLSQENRVKILPIPPTRGLIFSRDGVLLAENRPSFSLEVVPERVVDTGAVFGALKSVITITDEDIARFHRTVKKKRRFENVPLRFNLSEEEVARFAINRHRFPGIDIVARPTRFYPVGENTVHAVGYVGRIDEEDLKRINASNYSGTSYIGKAGVEKAHEAELHGRVGYQQVEVNAQGRILRVLERTPPEPGKDLYLTLDLSLQAAAIEALGEQRGAIVAIDPRTGGVLTMVSTPGYDPNPFVNGIDAKGYKELRDSPGRPLFNRALQGKYPPGSTVKPFVALAGLQYGLRIPEDASWCPGWLSLPGQEHRYRCWKKTGHGRISLKQAIAQSCDVYFYQLALDLGIDRLHDYLVEFGFGRPSGIDLAGERAGLLPSRAWKRKARHAEWYPGDTLNTGIGQGFFLATPMQLATAVATLANHGSPIHPTLANRLEDPVSRAVTDIIGGLARPRRKFNLDHWAHVVGAMAEVVHGRTGTAKAAGAGAAYRFAGKTGTSQVFGIRQNQTIQMKTLDKGLWDHALFIAFAPFDNPSIAVAIIVEHGGSGSGAAAPIARKLFDRYLLAGGAATGGNG